MHDCPECGSACYCGGDIDDINTGDEKAEQDCTHCLGENQFDDDDYEFDDPARE